MDNDSTKVDVTIIPIECGTNSLKIGLKYYYGPRKPPVEATCHNCPTCIAANRRGGSTLMEILIPTFYELDWMITIQSCLMNASICEAEF